MQRNQAYGGGDICPAREFGAGTGIQDSVLRLGQAALSPDSPGGYGVKTHGSEC